MITEQVSECVPRERHLFMVSCNSMQSIIETIQSNTFDFTTTTHWTWTFQLDSFVEHPTAEKAKNTHKPNSPAQHPEAWLVQLPLLERSWLSSFWTVLKTTPILNSNKALDPSLRSLKKFGNPNHRTSSMSEDFNWFHTFRPGHLPLDENWSRCLGFYNP